MLIFILAPPPSLTPTQSSNNGLHQTSANGKTFALSGEGAHPFTAECLAMKTGLRKLAKQLHPAPLYKRLLIATDCLSLVLALEKGPVNQKDPLLAHIWSSLYKLFGRGIARIAIQWVPAHCGITRNEFADASQDAIIELQGLRHAQSGMLYSTTVSYYKAPNRLHNHNPLTAEQTDRSKITSNRANLRIEDKFTRAQQSTLAQLRTGTCNSMGWYVGYCRNGLDSNHKNDICRWCGVDPETVLHVFNDCTDLQIQLLREEYRKATTKPFTATTLCTV